MLETVNVDGNIAIDRLLMIAILAAQGLFAVGRWVQGREATSEDVKRLEAKIKHVEDERARDAERNHRKANEIQVAIAQVEAECVSHDTFAQFARRYEALEARYNATHNGNH